MLNHNMSSTVPESAAKPVGLRLSERSYLGNLMGGGVSVAVEVSKHGAGSNSVRVRAYTGWRACMFPFIKSSKRSRKALKYVQSQAAPACSPHGLFTNRCCAVLYACSHHSTSP